MPFSGGPWIEFLIPEGRSALHALHWELGYRRDRRSETERLAGGRLTLETASVLCSVRAVPLPGFVTVVGILDKFLIAPTSVRRR